MSKSDVGLLALNLVTLLMAVAGLTAQHVDPMGMALALTLVTTIVNGGALLRRGRRSETAPRLVEADELDAHHVLDLDARLEALERAYGDAADAAKWRALVESGQLSGPAAPAAEADGAARARQNGRA